MKTNKISLYEFAFIVFVVKAESPSNNTEVLHLNLHNLQKTKQNMANYHEDILMCRMHVKFHVSK